MKEGFVLKTVDIFNKEWRDKVNGNTYFASRVTLNYGFPDEKTLYAEFQYGDGYGMGDQVAFNLVKPYLPEGCKETYFYQLRDKYQILTRRSTEKNCLQRDVKEWGKP